MVNTPKTLISLVIDILSGHGEAGQLEVSSLGLEVGEEIRDKAAKLLSAYREDERGEEDREAVR